MFQRLLSTSLIPFLFPVFALGADVKLLSWNVYMLPKPIKKSFQKIRDQVIPDQLSGSDYDIMFFQEAFTPTFRKAMIKKLSAEYPHNYYMKAPNPFSHVFGSGVFVMSRYPFKVLDKVRYKKCAGMDCYAAKGTYVVELSLPNGKTVQFVPTHLQSSDKNSKIRAQQLVQVRGLLDKTKKRGVPQVFLGDLNISSTAEEFVAGQETMRMKATQLIGKIKTTNARVNDCFKTPSSKKWIDHVWVSRENFNRKSTLQVIPTEFEHNGKTCPLSDHHAVEAHLVFN